MTGRWRFRIVNPDYSGLYASRGGRLLEFVGSDDEALALSRSVAAENPAAVRVEVVSVGRPETITDRPGRELVFVREREDKRGWLLLGESMNGTWHRQLLDAVSYGAFRSRGMVSETRILNAQGAVTHVVLIDSTEQRSRTA